MENISNKNADNKGTSEAAAATPTPAANDKPTLTKEVAGKYDMMVHEPGIITLPVKYGRETIDFTKLTIQAADALMVKYPDLPYLRKK